MKKLIRTIKKAKSVAVFGHISIDCDCYGSLSAISFLCRSLEKKVDVFVDQKTRQERLEFLDPSYSNADCNFLNYDLLISVDVASKSQLGKYGSGFVAHNNKIVIDHHQMRDLVGDITYVQNKTSSASEIIYNLFMQAKVDIPKDIATLLYAGVSDDTGCFVYTNTNPNTHIVAAKLLQLGADLQKINYNLFQKTTKNQMKLFSMLEENSVFEENFAYRIISKKELTDANCVKGESSSFVQRLLNIENNKFAFVLTEINRKLYSLSIKCLCGYDVSIIAKKFGGGGHKQASGAKIVCNDVNILCERIKNEIKKQLKNNQRGNG